MAMRVLCDLCGVEPAAVLCCADDAVLCSPCDRRIHGANKIARKHRRLALIHPSYATNYAATPLCDVCKDRRGLVFCVDGRVILCADCDEPIHSPHDPTSNHTRLLLIGAKLSAEPVLDQETPSPDGSPYQHDESVNSPDDSHGREEEEAASASSTEALANAAT